MFAVACSLWVGLAGLAGADMEGVGYWVEGQILFRAFHGGTYKDSSARYRVEFLSGKWLITGRLDLFGEGSYEQCGFDGESTYMIFHTAGVDTTGMHIPGVIAPGPYPEGMTDHSYLAWFALASGSFLQSTPESQIVTVEMERIQN